MRTEQLGAELRARCVVAEQVLAFLDRDHLTGALWALDHLPRRMGDLQDAGRRTASGLPLANAEARQEAADTIVRAVRLHRALAAATNELLAGMLKALSRIARALQRRRQLTDALGLVCEHLSVLTGTPVLCRSSQDGSRVVLAEHPRGPQSDEATLAIEIDGASGGLGELQIVLDPSQQPGPLAFAYLKAVGAVLELTWTGALHEATLSERIEQLEHELRGLRAAIADHNDVDGSRSGLTAREREVLALLQRGASNASIAERLYVSLETAKTHVKNILRKLGSVSRTELIAPVPISSLRVDSGSGFGGDGTRDPSPPWM